MQLPPELLTRGLPPPDPRSLICPQLNLLNPPPPPRKKKSWVRHCLNFMVIFFLQCLDARTKLHCSQNLLSCTVAERTRVPTGVLIWCSWNSADSSVTTAWCTTLALLLSLASGLLASPSLHWLQWGIPTILHTSQTTTFRTPAA